MPSDSPSPYRRAPQRVAFLGYVNEARDQAMRLRALGWQVDVVVRPGGTSWIRAVSDGFRPVPPSEAAARADVVYVHLPEREQPSVWAYSVEPFLAPGALVAFARGSALYAGSVDPSPDLDVVLLRERRSGAEASCHVAVHRDATGRALERSAAFGRAVFGATRIGTTTLDAEVYADISALMAKMGGLPALLAEWDRVLANPGHEPDEATLGYYERLRAAVAAGLTGADRFRGPETTKAPSWRAGVSRTVMISKKRGAA